MLEELSKIKIANPRVYTREFIKLVDEASKAPEKFAPAKSFEAKKGKYSLFFESSRTGSFFTHLVPSPARAAFLKLSKKYPNAFLGLTVKCGTVKKKDVRVSCFGIPCYTLTKAMIKE